MANREHVKYIDKYPTRKLKFPWLYLLLAYGLAWAFWVPVALTGKNYQETPLLLGLVILGAFAPGAAGCMMTYFEGGISGWRDFRRRMIDFRMIQLRWYLIILLIWPAMHLLAIALYMLTGGSAPVFESMRELATQPAIIPAVVVLYFIQAAVEEPGWRGYMFDKLQRFWGFTLAVLVVGLFHAFWHLPLFFIAGTNQIDFGFGWDFWLFVAAVMASSVFTSWCYMSNQRSILAAMLIHFTGNLFLDIFSVPGPQQRVFNLLFILGAILVLVFWNFRKRREQVTRLETVNQT